MNPLVSILIVTWNRSAELARCLRSVREQTYGPLEVIVVDNASPDDTQQVVRDLFPEVTLVAAPVNLGCPSGRNFGFKHCRGAFIYQLDDDGWLAPDAIEKAVARATSDARIGAVMSAIHWADSADVPTARDEVRPAELCGAFVGCCTMLRRSALDRVGVYPDDYDRQGEEESLSLRLMDEGYVVVREPRSVMYHKPSPVGRSQTRFYFLACRNSAWTALRLWPFPYNYLRQGSLLARAAVYAARNRVFALPLRLIAAIIRECGSVGRRRPVGRRTFRKFRRLLRRPEALGPLGKS